MISVACPTCSTRLKADDQVAGELMRCSRCQSMVEIPLQPPAGAVSPLPVRAKVPAELLPQRQTPWLGYATAIAIGSVLGLAVGLVLFTQVGATKLRAAQAELVAAGGQHEKDVAQIDELRRSLHASLADAKSQRERVTELEDQIYDHKVVMRSHSADAASTPRAPRGLGMSIGVAGSIWKRSACQIKFDNGAKGFVEGLAPDKRGPMVMLHGPKRDITRIDYLMVNGKDSTDAEVLVQLEGLVDLIKELMPSNADQAVEAIGQAIDGGKGRTKKIVVTDSDNEVEMTIRYLDHGMTQATFQRPLSDAVASAE